MGIDGCILFHFYIKPQPLASVYVTFPCCILFHFYRTTLIDKTMGETA